MVLWLSCLILISIIVAIVARPVYLYFFNPTAPTVDVQAVVFLLALLAIAWYHSMMLKKQRKQKNKKKNRKTNILEKARSVQLAATTESKMKQLKTFLSKTVGLDGKYFVHRVLILEVIEIILQGNAIINIAPTVDSYTWAVGATGLIFAVTS